MFPKIKKKITKFFLDETGKSPKKSIVYMGILSFAVSATAVSACWDNDAYGTVEKYWENNAGELSAVIGASKDGNCDEALRVKVAPTRADLERLGFLTPLKSGYSEVNKIAKTVKSVTITDHVSCYGAHCHTSDHWSASEVLDEFKNGDNFFAHKNELSMKNEKGDLLRASHFHDVQDLGGGKITFHASDHWDSNDHSCHRHKSDSIH